MSVTQGILFKRHGFPADVIRQAVWLYFHFTLGIRDVEVLRPTLDRGQPRGAALLGQRIWTTDRGPDTPPRPSTGRWRLDEMVVKIGGRRTYLWRAVDDELLDVLVQKAAQQARRTELPKKLLKNLGIHPETITTDRLASYRAAARDLCLTSRHRPVGMRENNRAENSRLAIRRRESSRCLRTKVQATVFSPVPSPATTSSTSSPI